MWYEIVANSSTMRLVYDITPDVILWSRGERVDGSFAYRLSIVPR